MKEFEFSRSSFMYNMLEGLQVTPSKGVCGLFWQCVLVCAWLAVLTAMVLLAVVALFCPFLYLYAGFISGTMAVGALAGSMLWCAVALLYGIFLWDKYVSIKDSNNIIIVKVRSAKQKVCPRVKIVD